MYLDKTETVFFTVCSLCYLPKALVLAGSLYAIEEKKIIIYIADKKREIPAYEFCEMRWLEDENIPDFYHLAFIYDVTEFSTCVKPFLALKLIKEFSKIIYLDPDIYVYSKFDILYSLLNTYPIILTPHYTNPKSNDEDQSDLAMMRFGSFNMGFFAVTNNPEAKEFLEWWSIRCFKLCYFETQFGLSTDQKWVSIAPCFFKNIYIDFNPGMNMAFWNLHERYLAKKNKCYIVNDNAKLVFFHF